MTDRNDAAFLEQIVSVLVATLGPEKIVQFGSSVRGELRPDSDLDLLVVLGDSRNPDEEMRRAYRVLGEIKGRPPVDVLVFTRADVDHWRDVVGHVVHEALAGGRIVYDAA
jgi:predicted nucleotidyltransferase